MPGKKMPPHQNAYDEMTRSIAHKIRNQLTILLTSAELASKKLENKEAIKKFIDIAKNNVLRLITITDAMMKQGRGDKND